MTMKLIASTTLGSSTASVTFSSLSGYTDLVIKFSARTDGTNGTLKVYFNNDTTNTNYNVRRLLGGPGTVASNTYNAPYFAYANRSNQTASTFNSSEIYIPNYNGSTYKSISSDSLSENSSSDAEQFLTAGIWNNTAAITSIKLETFDPNFVSGSIFSIYGITKGSGGATVS